MRGVGSFGQGRPSSQPPPLTSKLFSAPDFPNLFRPSILPSTLIVSRAAKAALSRIPMTRLTTIPTSRPPAPPPIDFQTPPSTKSSSKKRPTPPTPPYSFGSNPSTSNLRRSPPLSRAPRKIVSWAFAPSRKRILSSLPLLPQNPSTVSPTSSKSPNSRNSRWLQLLVNLRSKTSQLNWSGMFRGATLRCRSCAWIPRSKIEMWSRIVKR